MLAGHAPAWRSGGRDSGRLARPRTIRRDHGSSGRRVVQVIGRRIRVLRPPMDDFLTSTGLVALAEIGDKTQLLSLLLAARFRRPWPIIAGMLVATLANHAAASALGAWLTTLASPQVLRWSLGLSFIAMAGWMLVPDKAELARTDRDHLGVFATTLVAFFLAEMGDKTQIATIALAGRFGEFLPVVLGTTAGMMLVNVPVVLVGDRFAQRAPRQLVHGIAAAVFATIGLAMILDNPLD